MMLLRSNGTVSKHDKGVETEVEKALKKGAKKKKKKTTKESFELWEIAPSFDYSGLREKYYNKEIFKRGDYSREYDYWIERKGHS